MNIRIKQYDTNLPLPQSEPRAVGQDLYCREDLTIPPHEVGMISVNVAVEIPEGYFLLLAVRSSTPLKKGLTLANGMGIVDPFFCGDKDELLVQLLNFTNLPVEIKKGERLVQAVLVKHEPITWQEVDSFGTDGHGGYVIEKE
jgi:dUTP pyrophosphatase